ncbi:protein translocase subunit SecDF [Metamycoplasma spumans]|uniref:protein translocase subunit SecDF n=1 Tax=Metamycoplasma spumans TaxID=92406 RepID=UPI0034DDC367
MKKAKFFTNKFRWIINIFIIIAMLLTTILGGVLFLGPKLKNQNNSNVIQNNIGLRIVKTPNANGKTNQDISSEKALNLTENFILNKEGIFSSSYDFNLSSENLISINNFQDKTQEGSDSLITSLVNKPYLTVTDSHGNPLFYKGQYISRYNPSSALNKNLSDFITDGPENFYISLENNPATTRNKQGASHRLQVKLTDEGWDSFVKLRQEYQFINGFQNNNDGFINPERKVYFWLNLHEFIKIAKEKFPEQWQKSGQNPVNFAYINNSANIEEEKDQQGKTISRKEPVLKLNEINARKFLIYSALPELLLSPLKTESSFYLLNNNEHGPTDKEIEASINFSYAPFKLEKDYSYFVTQNVSANNKYLIVLASLFALFAVFLIIKYRLFGLVSVISLGLFIFAFISIVTAFNISINPIVALIIMFICFFAFDLMHNKLDIFKKESIEGSNPNKAINKASKNGIISGLDVSVGLIVISIFGIFINLSYGNTLSTIMFIAIFASAIIIMLLNTWLLRSLVKTEAFDKKEKALLWNSPLLNKISNKLNLISKSRYYLIGFGLFIFAAILVFAILAGLNKNILFGINLSTQLSNSYHYYILPETSISFNGWNSEQVNMIASYIISELSHSKVQVVNNNLNNDTFGILITSLSDLSHFITNNLKDYASSVTQGASTSINLISEKLNLVNLGKNIGLLSAIIFGSLSFVLIYVAIRFSFISMFVVLIKQILGIIMIFAFMMVTYTEFNQGIYGGLILFTMFNIWDSLINANRIKGDFKGDLNTKNYIYSDEKIEEIFKLHVKEIFARQIMNLVSIIAIIVLSLTLMQALNKTGLLVFSFGVISTVLLNLFLIPNLWMRLTKLHFHKKIKRMNNGFWNTEKIEEQTFIGINDYSF